MALYKTKLRPHANVKLPIKQDNGLLCTEQIEYIVSSAVRIIDHRKILVLSIYSREKVCEGHFLPLYTIFQTKDDHITLERADDGSTKWRTAQFDSIKKEGYGYVSIKRKCTFFTPQDEERVTKYVGIEDAEGLDALSSLQKKIMMMRRRIKAIRREQAIIRRMESVPPLPRGFHSWMKREAVPHYVFYTYRRDKKPMTAYCTSCKKVVEVSAVKNNTIGVCPCCKKRVTFKAAGRVGVIVDRVSAQVFQKTVGGEMVLRIFKIFSKFTAPDDHYLSISETLRVFLKWSSNGKIDYEDPFYDSHGGYKTNWHQGIPPVFSCWQYSFQRDRCAYLYTGNLKEVLGDTVWKYCPLVEYLQKDNGPLELLPFLTGCIKYPATEYLIKFGLTKLATKVIYGHWNDKVINPRGKTIRDVLHVEPQDIALLQTVNADSNQLELVQKMRALGKACDEGVLRWFDGTGCSRVYLVIEIIRYMTMERLMKYVDEQYKLLKSVVENWSYRFRTKECVISEYRDYLRMCQQMEYNMDSRFVLFPKNLMQAHDRTSTVFDDRKTQTFAKIIEGMYRPLRNQYAFAKGGFAIIPPRNVDEIIKEGHALHHCVGSYVKSVANNECTILFLRRLDSISSPFFTVEVSEGEVVQVRGQNNIDPFPEVKRFLKIWEAKKVAPLQPAMQAAA